MTLRHCCIYILASNLELMRSNYRYHELSHSQRNCRKCRVGSKVVVGQSLVSYTKCLLYLSHVCYTYKYTINTLFNTRSERDVGYGRIADNTYVMLYNDYSLYFLLTRFTMSIIQQKESMNYIAMSTYTYLYYNCSCCCIFIIYTMRVFV